jgi:hypothetical protein
LPAAFKHAERDKPGNTQFLHDPLEVGVTATKQRLLGGRLRLAGCRSITTLEVARYAFTRRGTWMTLTPGPARCW